MGKHDGGCDDGLTVGIWLIGRWFRGVWVAVCGLRDEIEMFSEELLVPPGLPPGLPDVEACASPRLSPSGNLGPLL